MDNQRGNGRSVTILVLNGLGVLVLIFGVAIYPREAKVALPSDALVWSSVLVMLSRLLLVVAWLVTIVATIARRQWEWLILAVLVPAALLAVWFSIAYHPYHPDFFQTPDGLIATVGTLMVTLVYATQGLLPPIRGRG